MTRMHDLTSGLAAAMTLIALPAAAADALNPTLEPGAASLNAEISLRAGLWTHDRDFGDHGVAVSAVEARIAPKLSTAIDAFAEGRLEADSRGGEDADLREGWVRFTSGNARVTVGRQIVVWGRADRLNPTDVVGSRDYTQLLANDDEQRRGSLMAVGSYGAGPWTLSALWAPEFRPNRFPIDRTPPGVVLAEDEHPRDRGQFGLHLDHAGAAFDWSVSYFDGVDRTRDIAPVAVPVGSPAGTFAAVQQQYPSIQVFGGDLAGVRGKVGYRAEAAYTHVRGADTPFRKNDFLWIVAGVDRTFDSGWNVNVQYSLRYVFDYADPHRLTDPLARAVALQSAVVNNQLDRRQNSVSLRAARGWINDTLSFEFTGVATAETRDVVLRPKLSYAFNDKLRGTLGADVFLGPKLSYFGRVQTLSAAYAQLIYGF